MIWFALASISLFLFTANASIIVPYPIDIPIKKRFPAISQTNFTAISGFCHQKNSATLGYWCRINLDGYVYGYDIEAHWWKDVSEHYHDVCPRPVQVSPVSTCCGGPTNGKTNHSSLIVGLNISLALLLFVVFGIYSSVKKHTVINIKSRLFKKNGGLLLEQHIASHGPGGPKIFTAEEIETTDPWCYFNGTSRTINSPTEASSTSINRKLLHGDSVMDMVFITEKVLVEEGQIEHFVNEVITLAQINHQNVIKFLGCCLETEVPILVYELAANGTLFDYIHDRKNGENVLPHWDILIEIASESAAGLAYLHSLPIIHGNVKSSNILLTNCSAKVAGFGPPRLVPSNEFQISTLVQRTLGYLDPEYFITGQLTDKSDVYSFGVVLVEILTGKKAICFNRPENQRIIIRHFLLSMEKQDGLYQILAPLPPQVKEENKEQVRAVAELAKQCLKLSSAERPTMEEVASELKRLSDTYLTVHVN